MSPGAVEITAIVVLGILALFFLAILAAACEWVSFSASLRAVPRSKRKPGSAVEVRVLADAEPGAAVESITAARRAGA